VIAARNDIAELASSLRPSLLRLVRVIRQQRAEISVTLSQLSAMGTLDKSGPMSAGELAACERVQPPSMTKVLASLDEAGYIRREAHPTDGRQIIIALTAAGVELIESERRARDAWLDQRLAKLDPDEREAIRKVIPVLDKLAGL
jgi:DNA-binding MarR family transcriptional regulator